MKPTFKLWRPMAGGAAAALGLMLLISGCAPERFSMDSARSAAAHGDARALYFLAKEYARGVEVPKNAATAAEYMRRAAERGLIAAQNDLGVYCFQGFGMKPDPVAGAAWFRKAAEQGDPLAEYSLGLCYAQGRGVPQDNAECLKWYLKAGEKKQPDAVAALGTLYQFGGEGVQIDYSAAVKWYALGRKLGNAICCNNLGFMYERGLGIGKNPRQAMKCYRAAAAKGFARAYASLGYLYLDGFQLKQDLVTACQWFIVGADQGDGIARHYLQEMKLKKLLSPAQAAEAQQRARDYEAALARKNPPA